MTSHLERAPPLNWKAERDAMSDRSAADDPARAQRFRDATLPHLDAVYNFARYLLRNPSDADDAVQECYLRALRHFDTLRSPDVKPWLFAILRNVCRAEYGRRSRLLLYDVNAEPDGPEGTAPMWQEEQSTPETEMVHKLDAETIQGMVAALPEAFREVIVLREIDDLSYREIAEIAGVPAGTVMSRLARARAMLRDAWVKAETENTCGGTRGESQMTCEETHILLHALIDNELDAGHAREVEAHAASCPRCTAHLRDYREMHEGMSAPGMRYQAPERLRARIETVLPKTTLPSPRAGAPSRRSLFKGFAMGSVVSTALAACLVLFVVHVEDDQRIVGDVVSAHLRSLQGDHLIDVQSTDQHTVKPWFNGRLDVAPPVIDLTTQGFTLVGGRLDYIDARPGCGHRL